MLIHPSHQPQARRAILTVLGLLVLLLLLTALPASLREASYSYAQPVHIALETLGILLGGLIFALIWFNRSENPSAAMLVLACCFAGIVLLDFSHTLSAPDMPAFITPNSVEKSILFSLAARLLSSCMLVAVAVLSTGKNNLRLPPRLVLASVLSGVVAVHVLILAYPKLLPHILTVELDSTSFKIGSHYLLFGFNLLAAALFFRQLRTAHHFSSAALFAAACIMAQSEILFTIYREPDDLGNFLVHLFKLIAYFHLFRAIFVETVQLPYQLLRNSERQLAATLTALPDLLFEIDGAGNYVAVHSKNHHDLTIPVEILLRQNLHDSISQQYRQTMLAAISEARQQGHSQGKLVQADTINGNKRWFELSVARKSVNDDEAEHFLIISRDVTERQEQTQTLRTLSLAVEQNPSSIFITDADLRIQYVNEAFIRSSGYEPKEVIGRHPLFLSSARNPADLELIINKQIRQGRHWRGELVTTTKSGREFTESVLLYAVQDEEGVISHFLAIKEDISEKRKAAERIRQLSHYDQLTGLPNRELLAEYYEHLRADNLHFAMLWIDLDHFKDINDALGHTMGDLLLQEIASRLRNTLRVQDVLCRMSGDDFVAILPDADQNLAASMSRSIIDTLAAPVALGKENVSLGASIGIALAPDDAVTLEALLQKAEIAMYRMKEDGRNDYSFFTVEMENRAVRTLALSNALKQAQARNELRLVYQPQMQLGNGRIIGAEALLRWNCPLWGELSPAEFIPIAEASGLIMPIGEWVLRTALQQLRKWHEQGLRIQIAVNLSALQFEHERFPATLKQLLLESGVAPYYLELELTEAVAMKTPELAAQRMQELSALGIQLAIDDFGTGYSSLSYLKRFKIHKLKIDQSFIRDLESDPDDCAIVSAIIHMAKSLGMVTIAEGVETSEQTRWLLAQACNEIQGFHLSRPLPAAEFEHFIRAHHSATPADDASHSSFPRREPER